MWKENQNTFLLRHGMISIGIESCVQGTVDDYNSNRMRLRIAGGDSVGGVAGAAGEGTRKPLVTIYTMIIIIMTRLIHLNFPLTAVVILIIFVWQGIALKKVPKLKFIIIIGGAKFRGPSVAENAYSSPVSCPSLHFLGTPCLPCGLSSIEFEFYLKVKFFNWKLTLFFFLWGLSSGRGEGLLEALWA